MVWAWVQTLMFDQGVLPVGFVAQHASSDILIVLSENASPNQYGCVQFANISVLRNGKQQLACNSDMPKPPIGQKSSLEENTLQHVLQPRRIFQL